MNEPLQSDLSHPRFAIDPLKPGLLWDWRETPGEVKLGLWNACELMSEVEEFLKDLPEPPEEIGLS